MHQFGLARRQLPALAIAGMRRNSSRSAAHAVSLRAAFHEYGGESYDGSSCRARSGWYHSSVCLESNGLTQKEAIPADRAGTATQMDDAEVYYRIDPQAITDLQAAIPRKSARSRFIYTRKGWDTVKTSAKPPASMPPCRWS
jgi:hypothetical protein